MAITISNLSSKKAGKNYFFADLHLDLLEKQISTNKQNNKIYAGNDIVIDADEKAIENSVVNLLFQKRYLNPAVNLQLRKYLGQPMSEGLSRVMGDAIYDALLLLEPRIKVHKVIVGPNTDRNAYHIAIVYALATLQKVVKTINGLLDINGSFTAQSLNNS